MEPGEIDLNPSTIEPAIRRDMRRAPTNEVIGLFCAVTLLDLDVLP
jgi:hypothetical protein